jgi:hypothetical protein
MTMLTFVLSSFRKILSNPRWQSVCVCVCVCVCERERERERERETGILHSENLYGAPFIY